MPSYWTCRKCSHVNVRTSSRRCLGCGENTKRARRPPAHTATLRTDTYEFYAELSQRLHGGEYGACGVCGKPKPAQRRHHRDHDHLTGKPRGLACVVCNRERLRENTLADARAVVAYLERAA